jgi:uncharacterized coiled-coil protein SlyX
MKKTLLNEQAIHLMEMIREQNDTIMSYETQIPKIELDILMENVRKLYEVLKQLEKRNNNMAAEAVETPPPPVVMSFINHEPAPLEEAVQTPSVQDMSFIKEEPSIVEAFENPPVVSVQPEELLAVIETPVPAPPSEITREEVMPQAAIAKDTPKPSAKSATLFDEEPHTLADTFQSTPTLNDRLASTQTDDSIATKLKSNPVTDLKKAIGINEKFALINELFHGDINAYNDAIEVLNTATDELAAISYLEQTLASKYGWDTTDESYLKLHNLVQRRY